MKRLAFLLALASCSPAYRAATGRCASTATLVTDVVIAGAGLAASADRYNAGERVTSIALFGAAMTVALAANLSECR